MMDDGAGQGRAGQGPVDAGRAGPGPVGAGRAAGPVLALDLGGTQIRAAVVTEDGAIHARRARGTPVEGGPEAIVAACRETLLETRQAFAGGTGAATRSGAASHEDALVGIAISSPGPIDPWRGVIVEPPNLGPAFRDIPLAERMEAALGLPAYLDRDTQIAALGEGAFGAARDCADFLYVTVSSGVGGAIVSDGRLLVGPDGTAGELGHLPVDFHGPPCGCGTPGHLEAFASGVAIAREARRRIASGLAPDLEAYARELAAKTGLGSGGRDGEPSEPLPELDARDVAEAEEAGAASAREIMDEARRAFAAAAVGWVDVFDPELIVVGGSIARGQGDRLLGPARDAIARYAFRTPARRVRVVPAALGDDVSLVGGLVLVATRAGDERWRLGRPPLQAETTDAPAVSASRR